jgi:membrane-bound serine protease (ClpP class)
MRSRMHVQTSPSLSRNIFTAKAPSYLLILLFFIISLSAGVPSWAQTPSSGPSTVWVVELDGPVGPATADHITRNLRRAAADNAQLFVLRMDTPGGLDTAMRDIVSAILASPVPVATWVGPSGARAASAGTYILTASHIAAMAPATNVGSSTPVNLGGSRPLPWSDDEQDDRDLTDMEQKVINDAVAYLKGLAELRGRNTEWAEETVRRAANLSSSEALANGVIDLVSGDLTSLIEALNGHEVTVNGVVITLALDNPVLTIVDTGWRHDFLSVITNPNIAYILLMIGIYGLILEFYNPGLGLPGVTGIICLLVAAYALQMLPVSYVGLALMAIGVGLMAFEVMTPSFGVFGLGGLIAFVLGSVMLMDTDLPAYQISLPLIAGVAVGTGGLVLLIVGAAIRARQQPVTTGNQAMNGAYAIAMEDFEHRGHVHVNGETWTAETDRPVKKGDHLRVVRVNGLLLSVTKEE